MLNTMTFQRLHQYLFLTAGLLGEQYVGLLPGFIDESVETLQPGDFIEDTKTGFSIRRAYRSIFV